MFDVILRGGTVLDGTGAPRAIADIAIADGRIAEVGAVPAGSAAAETVDATGAYLLPGFIDAHVHGDAAVLDEDTQLAALSQGVTTFVLGQDGVSYAPAGPAALAWATDYFAAVNGAHPALPAARAVGVADLRRTWHRTTRLNTAYLLPHGTIRHDAMGTADRAPTAAELAAMLRAVETGLDEGAVGLSTGLEYFPGGSADAAEIAALATACARRGLPYVSHMRGYEDSAATGMAELLDIARRSGAAAHVSHYHGPAERLAALVDAGLAEGIDLSFDSYPYLRGSSILAMVALPPELTRAGAGHVLAVLADPAGRARLTAEWFAGRDELWPRVTFSHVPAERFRLLEGMTLPAGAALLGLAPAELVCEVLLATRLQAGCVFGQPPGASEESVRALLRHRAHMGGSDGIYVGGRPHPRGWGAFARLLRRHTVELGDLSWEQAAEHLAARAARRFGLTDRGLLRPGHAADIVVLDPASIADRATYADPRRPAAGVGHVLVNGVTVLRRGRLTAELPGTPLPR